MPTQLDDYVTNLAPIYRDILAAFPQIDPGRKRGFGLAMPTISAHLSQTERPWTLAEIQAACDRLAARDIATIWNRIFVHPTDIGERLITKLTGKVAPEVTVPELAAPPVGE